MSKRQEKPKRQTQHGLAAVNWERRGDLFEAAGNRMEVYVARLKTLDGRPAGVVTLGTMKPPEIPGILGEPLGFRNWTLGLWGNPGEDGQRELYFHMGITGEGKDPAADAQRNAGLVVMGIAGWIEEVFNQPVKKGLDVFMAQSDGALNGEDHNGKA